MQDPEQIVRSRACRFPGVRGLGPVLISTIVVYNANPTCKQIFPRNSTCVFFMLCYFVAYFRTLSAKNFYFQENLLGV